MTTLYQTTSTRPTPALSTPPHTEPTFWDCDVNIEQHSECSHDPMVRHVFHQCLRVLPQIFNDLDKGGIIHERLGLRVILQLLLHMRPSKWVRDVPYAYTVTRVR